MDSTEDKNRRLEEAADWFEQKREGTIDQQAFDRWIRDSRNMEAWLHTRKANEGLQKVRGGVELIRELGLGREDSQADRSPESHNPSKKTKQGWVSRRGALLWTVAGAGVCVSGLAAYLATARESAQTKTGEQRLINLPDGAVLDLNTETKAYWRVNASTRDIWLERGELALTANNSSRPFVVIDGNRPLISISDGMLNLRRTGEHLNVTVLKGGAQVHNSDAAAKAVSPGTLVDAVGAAREIKALEPKQLEKVALWKQRQISFDGETLAQAVGEFNRYLTNKIVVEDDELNSLRILATGNWRIDAPDEFLDSLSASFDLAVKRESTGGYLIQKKAAGQGV